MLQEDFRRRALLSVGVVAVMALLTFLTTRHGAPEIYRGSFRPSLVWIVQGATAILAILAFVGLFGRRYKLARVAAVLQVTCILWGWGTSQMPYPLQGNMTITDAAASPQVLWSLIGATTAGVLLLFPSFGICCGYSRRETNKFLCTDTGVNGEHRTVLTGRNAIWPSPS